MRVSGTTRSKSGRPRVFMMDLWATVPYYTAYLCRALLAAGVDVQIGSITYYLDRECFRSRGLRLHPGFADVVGRLNLPRTARRALKLAEGTANLLALAARFTFQPPEIVHVQFLPLLRSKVPADLWFVRYCRRRGSRLVLTVHDLMPHDTGGAHRATYARLYAEMDTLICHSTHIEQRLIAEFAIPKQKISVIPHGPFFYDLPAADGPETLRSLGVGGGQMVLWQGILFPYKGVDLLLNAWRRVEAATEQVSLIVLGTGAPDLLAGLQQQARTLGLRRVHFQFRFCSTEELVAAYRAATAVVYPYRAITTSGALATGLALGKAIVASDLPVFREHLVNEETALLVDPADEKGLAKALLRITGDAELRQNLSRNVQALEFGDQSWAAIASATSRVYDALLERERAALGSPRAERK